MTGEEKGPKNTRALGQEELLITPKTMSVFEKQSKLVQALETKTALLQSEAQSAKNLGKAKEAARLETQALNARYLMLRARAEFYAFLRWYPGLWARAGINSGIKRDRRAEIMALEREARRELKIVLKNLEGSSKRANLKLHKKIPRFGTRTVVGKAKDALYALRRLLPRFRRTRRK